MKWYEINIGDSVKTDPKHHKFIQSESFLRSGFITHTRAWKNEIIYGISNEPWNEAPFYNAENGCFYLGSVLMGCKAILIEKIRSL